MNTPDPIEAEQAQARWWQWHLGDRMVRHQNPEDTEFGCSWPECSWHGYRPGDDTFVETLPDVAPQSVASRHLEGVRLGEGGYFVYERDVESLEDELEQLADFSFA